MIDLIYELFMKTEVTHPEQWIFLLSNFPAMTIMASLRVEPSKINILDSGLTVIPVPGWWFGGGSSSWSGIGIESVTWCW